MPYSVATLVLVVALPLLGGCGQMGPLYMPPPETSAGKPVESPKPEPVPQQQPTTP